HPYPTKALERIWKEVLLYQFHDILPGSSITRVYRETDERYAALLAEVQALTAEARAAWAAAVVGGCRGDGGAAAVPVANRVSTRTTGAASSHGPSTGGAVLVTNSLSWPRAEWLRID